MSSCKVRFINHEEVTINVIMEHWNYLKSLTQRNDCTSYSTDRYNVNIIIFITGSMRLPHITEFLPLWCNVLFKIILLSKCCNNFTDVIFNATVAIFPVISYSSPLSSPRVYRSVHSLTNNKIQQQRKKKNCTAF